MEKKTIVEPERLAELRGILDKIPGSDRKAWILEVYGSNPSQPKARIDIRTGQPLQRRGPKPGQKRRQSGGDSDGN